MFFLFLPSPVLEVSGLSDESGLFDAHPHLVMRDFQSLDAASTDQPVSLGIFDDCSMDPGSNLKSLPLSLIAFDMVLNNRDE